MKAVEGFTIRQIGKEYIITANSLALINFNKMLSLNSSAAFLWKGIQGLESFQIEDMANLLVGEYGIDYELALKDSRALVAKWIDAGIVSE